MNKDITKVKVPQEITREFYNCMEQQFMTICLLYYDEFWKLFLNPQINIDKSAKRIDQILTIPLKGRRRLEDYYGFVLEKCTTSDESQITFFEKEWYIVKLNAEEYPLCKDLEGEGYHAFIIYGRKENDFLVCDVFYQTTDYHLPAVVMNSSEKTVYRVSLKKQIDQKQFDNRSLIEQSMVFFADYVEDAYQWCVKNKISKYESVPLMDNLQKLAALYQKDCYLLRQLGLDNPMLEVCLETLDEISKKVKMVMFGVIKEQLKVDVITPQIMKKKMELLLKAVSVEKQAKMQVLKIIHGEKTFYDELYRITEDYLEEPGFDVKGSVYEVHDGVSVLLLLNEWEAHISGLELDFEDFKSLELYDEFIKAACKKMLHMEWR